MWEKKQQRSIKGDLSFPFPFSTQKRRLKSVSIYQPTSGEDKKAGTELENTQNILHSYINIKFNKEASTMEFLLNHYFNIRNLYIRNSFEISQ